MKNKKVKVLSGICSVLVAFGAVSPCVNATEPEDSMSGLGEDSSSFRDAYYRYYIQNATAEEIFSEIKSRGMTKLEPEDFVELIKINEKISDFDKIKLIIYLILVDLLDLSYEYTYTYKLNMENLNWENYSCPRKTVFFHCISDFIEESHLEGERTLGDEFKSLNAFVKREDIHLQDVYEYFSEYCLHIG